MEQLAQGFVEATGYVAAIEVADAMAKAAKVRIVMAHKVDGPRVCVICEGDVAACQAAVGAGKALCESRGTLIAANVIPRPDQGSADIRQMMAAMQARKAAKKAERLARRAGTGPASAAPAQTAPAVQAAPAKAVPEERAPFAAKKPAEKKAGKKAAPKKAPKK